MPLPLKATRIGYRGAGIHEKRGIEKKCLKVTIIAVNKKQ